MSKYITTTQSLPKSNLTTDFVDRLLGKNNIIGLEGHEWKMMRSVFNPGFAASHLISLVPYIVDSSLILRGILLQKAQTNELFSLDTILVRYAIDIIGKITLDTDFDSQRRPNAIVDTFRRQVDLMPSASSIGPLDDINLVRPVRLWLNMRKLDRLIGAELDRKIATRATYQNGNGHSDEKIAASSRDRKRSVVDLALDAYEKENPVSTSGNCASSTMTPWFRNTAIDSLKTFIFAGHDTTATTIGYTLYMLHLHPKIYQRLVDEIDGIYGTGCNGEDIAEQIRQTPHTIHRLEYLNAIIKEVLRLFPPASTLRTTSKKGQERAPKDLFLTDPKTGHSYPLEGFQIWCLSHATHRHEDYFPDPIKFVPERFLPHETPYPDALLHTSRGKDAWRPFEKGPRSCVGQELAMIESKVLLATVVKDIDFTAEYDGKPVESWTPIETRDEYKDQRPGYEKMTIEGHRAYQVLAGAANPAAGLPGRVRLRKGIKGIGI
ncbi:hypothetical protein B0A52_03487 [Exophiala mesophila]|uniref:Cytochrome P450 n=1 Tax=Exophiala mesophila TaxID=212818 RepID=A0A438N6E7_EXOME|nr:hypothetical protein B0A52_03487 [Exophiala mesophila]